MIKRFQLNDYETAESMYNYLHYIVDGWLNFKELNGTQEHTALATLTSKSLSRSMSYLVKHLNFELTSRYLATYMSMYKKDCDFYFAPFITDVDKRKEICEIYRFENLLHIQELMNCTWFNEDDPRYDPSYKENFQAKTGMSSKQVSDFFSESVENSFGEALANQTDNIYKFFNCTSTPGQSSKCSDEEIAFL